MPKEQKFYQKPFTLHDLPKEERPRERLKNKLISIIILWH